MKIENPYDRYKEADYWAGWEMCLSRIREAILAALPEEKEETNEPDFTRDGWNAYKREAEKRINELFKSS